MTVKVDARLFIPTAHPVLWNNLHARPIYCVRNVWKIINVIIQPCPTSINALCPPEVQAEKQMISGKVE